MRNWVSRKNGSSPCATSRPKRDSDKPRLCASGELTLGGSWQWSPMSTRRSPPRRTRGTATESSVAWATSSTRMAPKWKLWRMSLPAPTVVVQMTSAPLSTWRLAVYSSTRRCLPASFADRPLSQLPPDGAAASHGPSASSDSPPLPAMASACACCARLSSMMPWSVGVTFSGLPMRTTLRPLLCAPSAMLSTATLLSEVASSGPRPSSRAKSASSRTLTCVLPVPGGPWTSIMGRASARLTAWSWELFRFHCSRFAGSTAEVGGRRLRTTSRASRGFGTEPSAAGAGFTSASAVCCMLCERAFWMYSTKRKSPAGNPESDTSSRSSKTIVIERRPSMLLRLSSSSKPS
mmetsp:Transcript_2929/g.8757  ORF Transcript_2929/g.8757 Transcript_2929/m.8757 type:complete len:349 (+) Transcript_2929:1352-2398(+)